MTSVTDFVVTSASAKNGTLPHRHFANIFGCTGENISPAIAWDGAPLGTKSFVVTIYDPDAHTGSGWWHWIVIDIPATVQSLLEGAGGGGVEKLPVASVQTNTDMGTPGYGGPCPPIGETHRYIVTVKALSIAKLDLPPNATGALVGLLSNMYCLAEATLTLTGMRQSP